MHAVQICQACTNPYQWSTNDIPITYQCIQCKIVNGLPMDYLWHTNDIPTELPIPTHHPIGSANSLPVATYAFTYDYQELPMGCLPLPTAGSE